MIPFVSLQAVPVRDGKVRRYLQNKELRANCETNLRATSGRSSETTRKKLETTRKKSQQVYEKCSRAKINKILRWWRGRTQR